jgi:hypothetical protein
MRIILFLILIFTNNLLAQPDVRFYKGLLKSQYKLVFEGKLLHKKFVDAKEIGCNCDNYIIRYILVKRVIKGDKRLENDVIRTFEHYIKNDRSPSPPPLGSLPCGTYQFASGNQ